MNFKSNTIFECSYCGERIKSGRFCLQCKMQSGRKEIFDANVKILKENKEKGYCAPETLKNWK